MKIQGENNKIYDLIYEGEKMIVNTGNRKAFVMRKMYNVNDGIDGIDGTKAFLVICKTTHQSKDKCCFGGFGFETIKGE